jgi:hypothetical protein
MEPVRCRTVGNAQTPFGTRIPSAKWTSDAVNNRDSDCATSSYESICRNSLHKTTEQYFSGTHRSGIEAKVIGFVPSHSGSGITKNECQSPVFKSRLSTTLQTLLDGNTPKAMTEAEEGKRRSIKAWTSESRWF